jgi:hypothetical protein
MMFAFIGAAALYVATDVLTVGGTLPPNVVMAALANGFMLAVASERLRYQLCHLHCATCSPQDSPFVHFVHGHALLAVHHHTRACSKMCHSSRLPHLFATMCALRRASLMRCSLRHRQHQRRPHHTHRHNRHHDHWCTRLTVSKICNSLPL